MRAIDRILQVLGAAYTLLFLLSLLLILPRYLSSNLSAFLLAIVFDTEPEGQFLTSFYAPLVWTTLPLTSMGLCLISWLACKSSSEISGPRHKLGELTVVLSLSASFVPAILVIRQLLIYSAIGISYPGFIQALADLTNLIKSVVSPSLLMGTGGKWVVPLVIFAESGLFFGFFLPGDSLLLTVGVLAAVGQADLSLLILFSVIGAIIGDQLSYATGSRLGKAFGHRYKFVRENMWRATEFYAKHGGKAVVLARFVPVVRTFAPIVAGAASMRYWKFLVFNIVGGILWVVSVTTAGFFVGSYVPIVADYLTPLILVVIVSSPLAWMLTWLLGRQPSPYRTRGPIANRENRNHS